MRNQIDELLSIFSSSAHRVDAWQKTIAASRFETMLELGVWKGEFAQQILQSCPSVKRYFMLDPWANLADWNKPFNVSKELFEQVYDEAMQRTEFAAERRVVLRGKTKEVIGEIEDQSLDFAYVDGDHTLRGITIDLISLLPKMKEGSIIGGDDFTPSPWQHNRRFEPTLVCPFAIYFAEAMDLPIWALPYGQFFIEVTSKKPFCFHDRTGEFRDVSLHGSYGRSFKSIVKKGMRRILHASSH